MAVVRMDEAELRKRITQIQLDQSLSDAEKAKKRQELLSGRWNQPAAKDTEDAATGRFGFDILNSSMTFFSMTIRAMRSLQALKASHLCMR